MDRKENLGRAESTRHSDAQREKKAREHILALGADTLETRPWRPPPIPHSAADLTQYALWRASDLEPDDLLSALSLAPAARAEIDGVETGLLFMARSAGLTWTQIADAMGFRSPQACQQYANRLSARKDKRQ